MRIRPLAWLGTAALALILAAGGATLAPPEPHPATRTLTSANMAMSKRDSILSKVRAFIVHPSFPATRRFCATWRSA